MTATRPNRRLRILIPLVLAVPLLAAAPTVASTPPIPAAPEASAFKIFLSEPGVYRVSYEDQVKAGLGS